MKRTLRTTRVDPYFAARDSRLPGYYLCTTMFDDGHLFVRLARKPHHCNGGYDRADRHRTACHKLIEPGELYIEYTGESVPFMSGLRYHVACAAEQGLIVAIDSQQVKP